MLDLLGRRPVAAVLGARQVGKTTLAREVASELPGPGTRFDLEDPADLARLAHPRLALAELERLVVLDEVQRRPDLFPVLRVLIHRPEARSTFLVLGCASPELLRQSSEWLAGRVAFHALGGFALGQVATRIGASAEEIYFWATHGDARLGLSIVRGSRKPGFEARRTAAPRVTRSMVAALATLGLERLDLIHAGDDTFELGPRIRAVALRRPLVDLEPLSA